MKIELDYPCKCGHDYVVHTVEFIDLLPKQGNPSLHASCGSCWLWINQDCHFKLDNLKFLEMKANESTRAIYNSR